MNETSNLLNKRALLRLGWTPALIKAILHEPDQIEHHKHGLRHWVEHLYCPERVLLGRQDPRFVRAMEKRKAREAQARARLAEIPQRYADWRTALSDAAAGMFQLNRYAKHRMCSGLQKQEIYELKNGLIAQLYRHGFCTAAWVHRLELARLECRECGGAELDCWKCGGSGIYREACTVEIWCFRFRIQVREYCWHQPTESVEFQPDETLPPQDWTWSGVHEKPVVLPKRKFAQAKELIRWVIKQASQEVPVEEEVPFDWPLKKELPLFDAVGM